MAKNGLDIGRNKNTPPADGHVPGRRRLPRLPEPYEDLYRQNKPMLLGRGQFGAKTTRLSLSPRSRV